ncbi:cytoplasmic protein [Halalkalibacillus sediminis]|uniref:Cytoplasmic protein n=1 Tax=Halalkalibacillus sediminis TaxID=2018042 RepID=A0A2I0QR67_9BACI|nr:NIPSNAP family protein [Halalkalibacillus sediminis]PKR76818.1 cytoplasmic protein [Halalkalibacillus sediminis]
MFYRRHYYIVDKDCVESFNNHFNQSLLPTQLKYGAKLVGRWMVPIDHDRVEIFTIYEYESHDHYTKIEKRIRGDVDHVERVEAWYEELGGREHVVNKLFHYVKNEEIFDTVTKDIS